MEWSLLSHFSIAILRRNFLHIGFHLAIAVPPCWQFIPANFCRMLPLVIISHV